MDAFQSRKDLKFAGTSSQSAGPLLESTNREGYKWSSFNEERKGSFIEPSRHSTGLYGSARQTSSVVVMRLRHHTSRLSIVSARLAESAAWVLSLSLFRLLRVDHACQAAISPESEP